MGQVEENPDPIVAALFESISLWLQNKLPNGPPYGPLTPKASGLLLDAVQRVKKATQMTASRTLEFVSIVSATTQEPMVRVVWGDYEGQLLPVEARELSFKLLDVCHAAEADSYMYSLLVDKMELPKEAAYGMISEFRDWRLQMADMQERSGKRANIRLFPDIRDEDDESGEVKAPVEE